MQWRDCGSRYVGSGVLCYAPCSCDSKLHGLLKPERKELAMSATLLYRIATLVFALFAVGHTYGFLSLRAPSVEGRAVYDAMNTVHFELGGRSFSYGGFYRGFGLSCTVSLVLSAFLSWHLGNLARSAPSAIGALGWIFFVTQLAGVVLSFLYFGLPPMVLSALVAVIVGSAAFLVGRWLRLFFFLTNQISVLVSSCTQSRQLSISISTT